MAVQRVSPRAQSRVIETASERVVQLVEGVVILDTLDRDGFDLVGGEEGELDALHSGRHRLRDIHGHRVCHWITWGTLIVEITMGAVASPEL